MKYGLILVLAATLAGCGSAPKEQAEGPPAPTPTLEQLRNLAYAGIEDEPVTLADGEWEGAPFREDSPLRPRVNLVREFVRTGDLDGRPGDEAVVLLGGNSGGTGEYVYLAVVGVRDGEPVNLATTKLGDRVQVKSADVVAAEAGRVRLEIVRPGPGDALCCPGEVAVLHYALNETGLEVLPVKIATHRLSLDDLADREWVLRHWSWDEPAPAEPPVTLIYAEGRFTGNNGCNSYFNGVEPGDGPGKLTVGLGGATKMFCPDPAGAIEMRFGRLLESVHGFGFLAGRLALSYEVDGEFGVMIFEGHERKETE